MQITAKTFIGLKVKTKSGQYLGRVRDFDVDADALEIKKIYVRPAGIVKGFSTGDLIVDKTSVLSIDDEKITVLDLTGGESAREKSAERKIAMDGSAISAAEMKN